MTGESSVRVSDLVPGQVFLVVHDPSDGSLHWLRGYREPRPGRLLAEVTVVANIPLPETAEPGRWEGNTYVVAKAPEHRLRVLHEGRARAVTVQSSAYVRVLDLHHPVCSECGELWPCRDDRLDQEARYFTAEIDNCCAHCGRPINGAWSERFFDGLTTRRFHIAKKYRANGKRCAVALAEARAATPGEGAPQSPEEAS